MLQCGNPLKDVAPAPVKQSNALNFRSFPLSVPVSLSREMMATVLRKVKLGNRNKSETVTQDGGWETEQKDVRRRVNPRGEAFVQCGRVCGLVNVCTGPADSMGSRRRRNRPHRRGNPHGQLTLFQSLQLRIDLWTTTTGNLLDRSFTRRFCHRKSDNELYRSNSFRFEKFDKQEEDLAQQVSLCDDYSLPVDFVNKRKQESSSSRRREPRKHIDVADNYFDPKDSKPSQRHGECGERARRRKRHSNPIDATSLGREFRDSLRVSVFEDRGSEQPKPSERRPSPYYYSDILNQDDSGPSAFINYQKPPSEPLYSQSSKQSGSDQRAAKGLESYHPFSAKENFEPKQGGLDFYDFASGKVRKKHRVVEVKGSLSKKRGVSRDGRAIDVRQESIPDEEKQKDGGIRKKEYVKSVSLDAPSIESGRRKKECRKSASLDIPIGESGSIEVGDSSNRFRPIVPVRETEEGIEGGDEEEEEVKRERKKSLKKIPQVCHYGYRDCLTGAPKKTFLGDEFSPAEIIQHVIHTGADSKSLLAACLAEWDAHARLMRPLTARTLTQCACAIGAQNQCVSSDEDDDDDDYHYSKTPLPEPRSQDSIRRRDFFKEPIPDGKNLGDEFVKGKKVSSEIEESKNGEDNGGEVKSDRGPSARDIFRNWDLGGFENWNAGYDDNSDSAEAYRIAREILEETENWEFECKTRSKQECRSTESLYDLENMRRGLLYETAFDCKISKSDDDLEELDRVTNHPVLHSRIGRSKSAAAAPLIERYTKPPRPGSSFSRTASAKAKDRPTSQPQPSSDVGDVADLVQNLSIVKTPTPPSTAPLPSKFCGHDDPTMTSIKSAPELPTSPSRTRLKDTRLPVKSLQRGRDSRPPSLLTDSTEPFDGEKRCGEASDDSLNTGGPAPRPQNLVKNPGLILEIKGRPEGPEKKLRVPRPRSLICDIRSGQRRNGRLKYSSTESMATSSSGGSLESLKSSTSEGNRSTSSSESHRSSSLSSHSSDSVGNVVAITTANLQFHLQQTNPNHHHGQNNKMHILSPISDKSSVEPASETSDNNKNNNSQKPSPEDHEQQTERGVQQHLGKPDVKLKRKALQNKNLINLGLNMSSSSNEAQGSDSGISVESRTPRCGGVSSNQTETDFSDLPFDMPKLRRRRLEQDNSTNRRLQEADACTSSSATSVDLRDLPFDMPKLRRRLRPATLSDSQASSSQSVAEGPTVSGVLFRPSMTLSLDLESSGIPGRNLNLDLQRGRGFGTMTLGAFSGVDLIDPSLPLEKQAWYHGAITRVEAEALLRTLREGSYLVRNSESTRQDYSLSLKSAKGFMHMRIQIDNSGQFILGQFSKPFDSIPDMIRHYSVNRLPIRGAEHMCLLKPVAARLL